ncbi:MAG: hypothetical protein D8M61_13840 [Ignavibacteriae bacterium]|nr:hypothetical protein [Ignavibacteriota bacterium]
METGFQYIAVSSEIADTKIINKLLNNYSEILSTAGGCKTDDAQIDSRLPLFYFVLTGGTENFVMYIVERRKKQKGNEPVYIIAHSSNNSLPASLEILARIKQIGGKGKIFYLENPIDENGIRKIKESVKFISVKRELENSRIGLIGEASDWLVASSPKSDVIKKSWGPEIIEIDLAEVTKQLGSAAMQSAGITNFKEGAAQIFEPEESEIAENESVYFAIKNIADKYQLNSLSIRCFDLVVDQKTTGCFAISQLNDEGIIAGCEGDLVSTVGMLLGYKLIDELIWMANPSKISLQNSTLTLAHCTVPRKMISNYNLRSHFESGLGVGIEGKLPEGRVTLFRLGGKNMEKLWTAEGELIGNSTNSNLCRTQAEIKIDDRNKLEELLANPLGNHLLMIYGNHSKLLEEYKSFIENN